jgi:hypothetical protein
MRLLYEHMAKENNKTAAAAVYMVSACKHA